MATVTQILCPKCHKANLRRARFCQHCGHDVILNNAGPRYYITRVIKEGGQGAVFEAIDDNEQVYAVKQMLDRFTDSRERAEAVDRFEAEARILQRLTHPRIPRVYVSYQDEGFHYLVMDFVRGEDLEDIIQRERLIAEAQVLTWAEQICDVLEYLHSRDPAIIFRDMKPSNVMIEPNGSVKLIDFGIAKTFNPTRHGGTQIGTPGYAPPEQYQGMATPRSDVYSLGATLHHMLTGRDPRDEPPFTFPPVYALRPNVSRRTSDTVQRALQMKPEDRFASIGELRTTLIPPRPQPAQVRVMPQPQPAMAAPATQATGSVVAQQQPVAPIPQAAATPAAPPAARPQPTQPAAVPQQPPQQRQQRSAGWGGCLFALVAMALVVATLLLAFPQLASYLPVLPSSATATPQTLIAQPFQVDDLEIIVPPGQDVRQAFLAAYEQVARERFGPNTRVNYNQPPAFIGEPEKIGEDANGTRYRATLYGSVVPG
ncbi:MAG TPA: serine/threonine-protein kinase [Roseiflexaceae bacterium]|nr:serine/threonine-protein kinase [Roseiflexaceae bacterium]